ncbi:MAG: DUF4381 domain-containing protein [Thiogranum sp.]|nr:DUF4381 domain-containing protein [Thiogranum sp.]
MNPAGEALPLRDIHLPEPVSWWPPAPGWWLLLILLALLGALGYALYRRHRRRALQRSAQQALRDIAARWQQSGNAAQLASELSILLRRLCLSRFPREQVAGLTGSAWLQRLDSELPGEHFTSGIGRALIEAPYAAEVRVDGDALLQLCERWIRCAAQPAGRRS